MGNLRELGPLLVRERRAGGITQRELAQRIGVVQPQIARWEAVEYRTASLERVQAVASALGVDLTVPHTSGSWDADAFSATPSNQASLLAADDRATYGTVALIRPVRDLGETAARIRGAGEAMSERFGITGIGVFGSFANGTQTLDSDVDLVAEAPDPGGLRFLAAGEYLEELLGRTVDLTRWDTLRPQVRSRVRREVIHVWHA